ncbi:MAG: hypothetical protein IJE04_00560 [Bacilli bacterium]|nr:hypothetical protein [Bacilli bacterium]
MDQNNNFNMQGYNGFTNNQPNTNMNNNFNQPPVNNQSPKKKFNMGLIVGIGVVAIVAVVGIVFGSKLFLNSGNNSTDNSNDNINNNVQNNDISNDSTINYDELMKMQIIINGNEIFLNKTTIDDFLESSKWENYEESSFSTEVNKAIVLKDGVNEITLTYLKSNNVIFQVTTNSDFDNNVTKIQYKDSYIGTLNIGDNILEEQLKEKYIINKTNYRFDIRRTNPSDLIILYEKSSPIVLNYLYHDEEYNLTGFSAWWYIY